MTKRDPQTKLQEAGLPAEHLATTGPNVLSTLSAEEEAILSKIYKQVADSTKAVVDYAKDRGCFVSACI